MNCTPRRRWAKAFADPTVAASLILPILAGCSAAEVHPRYEALKPKIISVFPVANETIHQLDRVGFGGFLQRGIIGAEEFDIPVLLQGALEESLLLAGYTTTPSAGFGSLDPSRPLPEGQAPPPFDGALLAVIESWWANTMGVPSFSMRYRLELRAVPGGELLYRNVVECRQGEDPRSRDPDVVTAAIRRSARRALSGLPR